MADSTIRQTNISKNELGYDAWGRSKSVKDHSILHGMFTFNVPITVWKEYFNGTERVPTNATSEDGKLVVTSGGTLADKTTLDSYRNPRYQPNRGQLYSTSGMFQSPSASGNRRWGVFTEENGAFFSLESGTLYAVVRTTTTGGGTVEDKNAITLPAGIDLSKGNVFDIQFQWRGVGGYKFFINLEEVYHINYLGTLTELSMTNPACPVAFEAENDGDEVEMHFGCVDVTSEGGDVNGKTYGSVSIGNNDGQISVNGYNQPVVAIRSKLTVGGLRNTRDTLALLASAYADQRCMFRVWATRDFTAITDGTQTWSDFGDGHLEYLEIDPGAGTTATFDTTKAGLIFGCRVGQDQTYATSALFEGRTDIYQTPGDMFVFTVHRETGGSANVGTTYEFAEEI